LKILDTKMEYVKQTEADVIATANPGCVLQLQYGVSKEGMAADVRYVVELLDEAYRKESQEEESA
jgi:glycolate oxidase iron-sulfur subunit